MTLGATSGGPVEDVRRELRRLLDRFAVSGARLERPRQDGRSPVDVVRPLLQQLADDAATLEGGPVRVVPVLAPHALGDQLAVLTRDVLLAAECAGEPRGPATLHRVHERLVDVRRSV